jgi:hypothetical protein
MLEMNPSEGSRLYAGQPPRFVRWIATAAYL